MNNQTHSPWKNARWAALVALPIFLFVLVYQITLAQPYSGTTTNSPVANLGGNPIPPGGIGNGLVMWLDASNPANGGPLPADGSPLATWSDVSGQGHNATTLSGQTSGTFSSSGAQTINGHPVVRFTRTGQSAGSIYEVLGVDIRATAMPATTIFTVYRPKSIPTGQDHGLWGVDNGAWDRFFLPYHAAFGDGVDDGIASLGPAGQGALVVDAGQVDVVRLMAAKYDNNAPGGSAIYFDGQVVTTFTDTTDPTAAQTHLFLGWDGDDGAFDGDIAEMLVYNRALSNQEICIISSVLGVKYGRPFTCTPDIAPGGVGTGLSLWLKANNGVYSDLGTTPANDGDLVSQWNDQTGIGSITTEAQISPTTNITYVAGVANYNPVVRFDGTDGQRLRGDALTPFDGDSTIFVVAQANETTFNINGTFASIDQPNLANHAGQGIYFEGTAYQIDGIAAFTSDTANTHTPIGNNYRILTGRYGNLNSTQNSSIYLDGSLEEFFTGSGASITPGTVFEIGGRTWDNLTNRIFDGDIAEVVYYGANLTAAEQNQVESYLAIKYGITLTGTEAYSYTASTGATVWDADANLAYHHDVAGVGYDNNAALYQERSQSINGDDPVMGYWFIDRHPSGNAYSFDIWGNNDGATNYTIPVGIYNQMERVWKVAESGFVGTVTLSVEANTNAQWLWVDTDTDFSNATAYALTDNGNGWLQADVDLTDGQYFTFAQLAPATTAPGGVSANLALWLKANDGISVTGTQTVTAWLDQTNNNLFTVAGEPVSGQSTINFNNVLDLNGDDYFVGDSNITFAEAFAVADRSTGRIIAGDIGPGGCQAYFFGRLDGNATYIGDPDPNYLHTNAAEPDSALIFNGTMEGGATNTDSRVAWNGVEQPSSAFVAGPLDPFTRNPVVGICGNLENGVVGELGEAIVYSDVLTDSDRLKVDSYLAVKYGITLGDVITPVNYLASDGTIIWDADSTYQNDVAGIGYDNASDLYQWQSQSINGDDPVLGIWPRTQHQVNGNGYSFDIWGNNDGRLVYTSSVPGFEQMERIWHVAETGSVMTITIAVSDTTNAQWLWVDTDTDFSNGTAYPLTDNGNGWLQADVDFTDGQYFTFAKPAPTVGPGPGGVTTDLALWLKANQGVEESFIGVSAWNDFSGRHLVATQTLTVSQPVLVNDSINFNPSVSFDGADDQMTIVGGILGTDVYSDINVYMVNTVDNVQNSFAFREGTNGEATSTDRISWHLPYGDGNVYWDAGNTVGNNRLSAPWGGAVDQPYLWGGLLSTDATAVGHNQAILRNGAVLATDDNADTFVGAGADFGLGYGQQEGSQYYDSHIAELVVITGPLSPELHNRVESYLAIKYGLTMPISYTNAAGEVIWDATADAMYSNNITGLGHDAASALYQWQSHSEEADGLVTLSSHAFAEVDDNEVVDGSFFVVGDNTLSTTYSVTVGSYETMARVWAVNETSPVTNSVGAITVSIPVTLAADFILVDDDGDFSNAVAYPLTTSGNALWASVDFVDGQYFTFAQQGTYYSYLPFARTPWSLFGEVPAIAPRPAASTGEVFSSVPVTLGVDTLPVGGHFYLSSSTHYVAPILIDDEIAFVLDGADIYAHTFSTADGSSVSAVLELPRSVLDSILVGGVTLEYRDVFGGSVAASSVAIIWEP